MMCKSGNIKHSKYKLHLNDRKIATTFYFNGIKSQHTQYIIMPLQRDIVIICKRYKQITWNIFDF